MKPDFRGMATVYDVLCQDGRTIYEGSFDHQDGQQVPLVFKHNHKDITNFVGYGILRKSDNPKGMRVEATFNNTREGQHALELVRTGVIRHLSIWANDLVEDIVEGAKDVAGKIQRAVKKGTIREVSLVFAGANPGAVIDDVIRHADDPLDPEFVVLDGVIIHTDEEITIGEDADDSDNNGDDVDPPSDSEPDDVEDVDSDEDSAEGDDDDSADDDVADDDEGYDIVYIDDLTDEELEELEDEEISSIYAFLDSIDEDTQDEVEHISHYGVKGMKWGVRRTAAQLGRAVKAADAAVGIEAGTRNRAALKAKIYNVIAGRQEAAARNARKDAAVLDNVVKIVEDQASGKTTPSLHASRVSAFKTSANTMRKLAKTEPNEKEAAKLNKKADSLDKKADTWQKRIAKNKEYAKQVLPDWKKAASEMHALADKYANKAQTNRERAKKAEDRAKGIKHSVDPIVSSLIHQSDDDTLTDILKTLNDEQEQLFNIVLHSAVTGEKLPPGKKNGNEDGPTVQEVFDTLSEEQQQVLYYLAGTLGQENLSQEGDTETMKTTHNIFDGNAGEQEEIREFKQKARELIHSARTSRATSLRDVFKVSDIRELPHDGGNVLMHAPAGTITNIDYLFPDARAVEPGGPMFYSRRMEWVENVLGDIRPRPFSRIKSWYADVTADEARARGYTTGNLKVDEVIEVLKRVTQPQTVYKRQKLDRDDMLDITEFDVVVWLKSEMRMMLREELARAILISDGRSGASDDKIVETNVRPIYNDSDVYTVKKYFNDVGSLEALETMDFAETVAVMDYIAAAITDYRGSGGPTFYCSPEVASKFLLLRNSDGVRIHKSMSEVAEALRVRNIVEVPVMSGHIQEDLVDPSGLPSGTYDIETIGIVVNLSDYVIGQDRGGETNFFDDFDIDYNQYKYLYETRLSGALVMPKSAVMVGNVTVKSA